MAVPLSDYTTGTITVAANGTAVTGTGTSWATLPAFREGDWFIANGWVNIIQSVNSNTSLTLAMPWRGGALTGQPYRLRFMSDGSRVSAQARALVELLGGSGSIEALAALSGLPDTIPIFTGPGSLSLIPRSDLINGVKFDAQVNTLAERAIYDGQPVGFTVLVSDTGDGRSAIYSRIGAVGNWSTPAYLTGPQGSANFNGTSTSSVAASTGNKTFTIAEPNRAWGVGQRLRASRTATPTQFVEGVVVSYSGNTLVLNVLIFEGTGSHASWAINPVGEPGTITGITSFWNTRLTADTTAAQARTGLGAGDVVGPASSVNQRIATFNGTTGSLLSDSGLTLANLLRSDAAQTISAANKATVRGNIGAQEDLGWRPIQLVDLSANVAAIVVAIPAGVTHLRFSGRVITATNTASTRMRLSTNGTTWLSSGYARAALFQFATTVTAQVDASETSFIFAYENNNTALSTQVDGQLDFHNSPFLPRFTQRSAAYGSSPANLIGFYHAFYSTSIIPTHLQIFASSGNMAAGTKILIEGC